MKKLSLLLLLLALGFSVWARPVIDDTPTRVQTTLDPGLDLVGTLRPKSVHEISTSRWALDCAGTDREHADYHAFKDYLEPLGIRRFRTQAGWARCEKDRGVYDFAWLDSIVFDAKKRGLEVWLETSYGNLLYPGGGGRGLGAGLPHSPEALAAWDRWVGAMAERYRGIVRDWCIWNEPDLSGENGLDAVFDLTLRSARIIKRRIPDARLAACAIMKPNPEFAEAFCTKLRDSGEAGLFTWFAYHHYTENPDDGYDKVEELRSVVKRLTPNLRLWQNESGVESEWCWSGALSRRHWTELKQAKWMLRRNLADLGRGNETAVFHAVDLDYRATTVQYGLCRYGLLKTEGQIRDFKIDKVKTAYYAVQNAVSVFNDAVETSDVGASIAGVERPALYSFRSRADGTPIAVFWNAAAAPSDCNKANEARLTMPGKIDDPVWVDVLTGNAYRLAASNVTEVGGNSVYRVPVYDSPAFVTDRRVLDLELSEYAKLLAELRENELASPVVKAKFYGPHPLSFTAPTGADYVRSGVSGRDVTIGEDCFDFAPFAGKALEVSSASGSSRPIPRIAGALVFSVRSPKAAKVPVFVKCDWFWRFYVGGKTAAEGEGSDCHWKRTEIELCAGVNEIVFWTRPGNAGRWFAGLRIGGVEIPGACSPEPEPEPKPKPKPAAAPAIKWIDGKEIPLEGNYFRDVDHYYDRLPSGVTTNVNSGVRKMKHHTSGMMFRFVTDSNELHFKWIPYDRSLEMDHMPSTGVSGIDVYRRDADGRWRFRRTGRIYDSVKGGYLKMPWTPGTECLVNLPLYNGIKEFSLGIAPKARISPPPPRTSGVEKPVVFYGTSITHGGCASRPGLSFPNIVGRILDVPIAGLGFSGSGRMEYEMSGHVADIDACCYVIDCVYNMNVPMIRSNVAPFVRNLRSRRPDVPIVIAAPCDVFCGTDDANNVLRRRGAMREEYEKLVASGVKGLFWLPSENQLGDDYEGTVDGVHLNDWGMIQVARGMADAVERAMNAYGRIRPKGIQGVEKR